MPISSAGLEWFNKKWVRKQFTIHRKNHFRLAHKLYEVCEKWNVGPKGWLDLDCGDERAYINHLVKICSGVTGDRQLEVLVRLYDQSDYKIVKVSLILSKHGQMYCVKPRFKEV